MEELQTCLQNMGSTVTDEQLERWTCLVYESMSAPSRTFHTVQHVFDISINCNDYQKIAAIFHDVIYYTVDGGLSYDQKKILNGVMSEDQAGKVLLGDLTMDSDKHIAMVISIFGFSPGQELHPFHGLNEFLSAAVMVRCLREVLDLPDLARIVTIIDGTIPFRKSIAIQVEFPQKGATSLVDCCLSLCAL